MTTASRSPRLSSKSIISFGLILGMMLGCVNLSFAGSREQAWRIYERLTGAPPSQTVLDAMTACINDGNNALSTNCTNIITNTTNNTIAAKAITDINGATPSINITKGQIAAAYIAMQDPNFLSVTVKNMVIPWTNKDQTVFAPLNDTAATLIGLIRDGADFRTALYDDVIYTGTGSYDPTGNTMYANMEHNNVNLEDPAVLVKGAQSSVTGLPQEAVAGVMTTRASARAFFYAGTNRAMLRFTFINYLCNDFGQLKDVTSNAERVRQDPSRSPGGDSSVFLNNCVGCHAGMDGMTGAFSYYNWGPAIYNPNETAQQVEQENITYQQTATLNYTLSGKPFNNMRVVPKFRQNFLSFPGGYETTDDSWINYWRVGLDANLGWGWGDNSGNNPPHLVRYIPGSSSNPYPVENGKPLGSAAQLGYELANTRAFARCQVLHAYRQVCSNDPSEAKLGKMADDFKTSNFNMLTAFSESAADCSSNL